MGKVIGYCRVSTLKQTNQNQKLSIYEYCHKNNMHVDDIVEVNITSRARRDRREIDQTLNSLEAGDTLIVHAIDRLGRSTVETLQIINDIANKKIELIIIKENMIIDPAKKDPINNMIVSMLSVFAELERNFISERTKIGLERVKASGKKLGRKAGSTGKSKYDPYKDDIIKYRSLGLSAAKIVNIIGIGTSASLINYTNRDNIKKEIKSVSL